MSNLVPFGKYRGQPVEKMVADREYCDWLMQQPWFADRFRDVYNVVINYGGEPTETPEHNRLQARFLDHEFCLALLRKVHPLSFDFRAQEAADNWEREERAKAVVVSDEPVRVVNVVFEVNGWDVRAEFGGGLDLGARYGWTYGPVGFLFVECKPSIGDDYPAVLRQVKGYRASEHRSCKAAVLCESFSARGATLDQVRRIFAASNIAFILLSEVEG